MKSAKKTFLLIDFISLVIIVIILLVNVYVVIFEIENDFQKNQLNETKKIDLIIGSIIDTRIKEFENFINNLDWNIDKLENYNFSDIFILDDDFTIIDVLKKEKNSGIFVGYNFAYSKVISFFEDIPDNEVVYSNIYISPDKTGLSIYIAKKINQTIIASRVSIELFNKMLKQISKYENNIIIIATETGFIVTSTEKNLPFSILPEDDVSKYFGNKTFFNSRIKSTVLDNDLVILTPASRLYEILTQFKRFYPYIILLLILIFILKTRLQISYIFKPLKKLLDVVQGWETEKDVQEYDISFESFDEIYILYNAFEQKRKEIFEYIVQIKNTNLEILKIKQYLKNIINSMPSMLISINDEGIINEWNEAAVRYFGINAIDALGKNLWDILPHLSKFKENCNDSIDENMVFEYKRELIKNGEEKFMDVSIFPLTENGEKSTAIRLDDITKLERTEQMLRQSQKMETIGTLAGGIAHDFNNVLGGIIGTMSLIKLRVKGSEDLNIIKDKLLEYIVIIDKCSIRASDMVNNLLTLSRKQESNFTYFDLNMAINSIEKISKNTFDKSINLDFKYYPEECIIYADINQIEQSLLNVCVNAAHAMTIMKKQETTQGGVLSVQIDKIIMDKHLYKKHPEAFINKEYWIISVSDTGVGIENSIINKIFDPFFTTKEKGKGTGLGLSMVYSIIQLHNGFIDLYSELNRGTTVNIYLPVPKEKISLKTQSLSDDLIKGQGTILVIDDEQMIRETYKEMLSECGYDFLLAENGLQGIDLYKNNIDKIKLVILDMSMPILSGIETYRQLKIIDPKIKVLMASGFRQDERAKQAMDEGVNKFLQKPFTINKLSSAIAELL
ncbi:MAG: response regulator [Candidatus Cloacimonadales bacterium]|jgi:PAS domain S-box-containing protein|nr:response regulator [Candidatus Cloacimonadales bacterium]